MAELDSAYGGRALAALANNQQKLSNSVASGAKARQGEALSSHRDTHSQSNRSRKSAGLESDASLIKFQDALDGPLE